MCELRLHDCTCASGGQHDYTCMCEGYMTLHVCGGYMTGHLCGDYMTVHV